MAGENNTGAAIQVGDGKIPPQIAEVYFNRLNQKPEFLEAFNAFMEGKELTPEQQEIVAKNMGIKGAAAAKAEVVTKVISGAEASPAGEGPQPIEIDIEFLKRIPLQDLLDIAIERLQHAVHDQFPKGVLLAIFVSRKKIQVAPAMMNSEDGLKLDDKAGASAVPDAGGQAIERVLKKVIELARGGEEEEEEDEDDE